MESSSGLEVAKNEYMDRAWVEPDPDLLLQSEYNTGTIKDFCYYGAEKTDRIPDFIKMKELAFWEYDAGKTN